MVTRVDDYVLTENESFLFDDAEGAIFAAQSRDDATKPVVIKFFILAPFN